MPLNRRAFATLLLAGSALPLSPRVARARPIPVVAASLLGVDKPETLIWQRIRDDVETRLPGRFAFRIVPNAALGGERDVAEGLRLGSIQASLLTMSALSAWVPRTQLFDMPFLFRDAAHLRRILDGETGAAMRDSLAAAGFAAPAFVDYGRRHLLTKSPVTRAEEVRGLRLRVIQSPLHADLWSAFGAQPTPIPIPETYNALSTGVVDAMDLTTSAYAGFRLYEVVPHLTQTAHIAAAGIVGFSGGFWSGLGEEERAALSDASTEAASVFDAVILADEADALALARSGGAQVHAPAERDEWARIGRSIWPAHADAVGGMATLEAISGS